MWLRAVRLCSCITTLLVNGNDSDHQMKPALKSLIMRTGNVALCHVHDTCAFFLLSRSDFAEATLQAHCYCLLNILSVYWSAP